MHEPRSGRGCCERHAADPRAHSGRRGAAPGVAERAAILDTGPEDRFDRITPSCFALLDAPIALVSLVDQDRQWFKSCYGLDVRETSRDAAFCAHVVHDREPMVVADTFLDQRFADNPLVLGELFSASGSMPATCWCSTTAPASAASGVRRPPALPGSGRRCPPARPGEPGGAGDP